MKKQKFFLLILHWFIILNFLTGSLYSSYMIFFVVRPKDCSGPLYEKAMSCSFELMVTRRLYAIEFWIIFSGFAIYLAITEILPRLNKMRKF